MNPSKPHAPTPGAIVDFLVASFEAEPEQPEYAEFEFVEEIPLCSECGDELRSDDDFDREVCARCDSARSHASLTAAERNPGLAGRVQR